MQLFMRLALYTAPITISFHSFSTEPCQRAIVGGKTSIVIRAIYQGCIALLLTMQKSAARGGCIFYNECAVRNRIYELLFRDITFVFIEGVTRQIYLIGAKCSYYTKHSTSWPGWTSHSRQQTVYEIGMLNT